MSTLHRNLPKLPSPHYQGMVTVHWTFCIKDRATGWLTPNFHAHFREILTHMGVRYGCVTPIYCLMPCHIHILLMGIQDEAKLDLAARFLRKHTGQLLLPFHYQKQAYDHVLNEKESERNAFEAICFYIQENPVRAKLCSKSTDYPYSGVLVPGYPNLNPFQQDFWDLFWKIIHRLTAAATKTLPHP